MTGPSDQRERFKEAVDRKAAAADKRNQ